MVQARDVLTFRFELCCLRNFSEAKPAEDASRGEQRGVRN